jgi:hypothetical protein
LPQGAILSPILFNIVANMLAIVINRAKEDECVVLAHGLTGALYLNL